MNNNYSSNLQSGQKSKSELDIMCLLGFIFSFLIAIVGLILSIIGYKNVKDNGKSTSRTLAKAGKIISIVNISFWVLYFLIMFIAIGLLSTTYSSLS